MRVVVRYCDHCGREARHPNGVYVSAEGAYYHRLDADACSLACYAALVVKFAPQAFGPERAALAKVIEAESRVRELETENGVLRETIRRLGGETTSEGSEGR